MNRPTPAEMHEIAVRARTLYNERIRDSVEALHSGEFLVLNVATGEFEVGADDAEVSARAAARFGDAPLFTFRVGHSAAYRLGGRFRVTG